MNLALIFPKNTDVNVNFCAKLRKIDILSKIYSYYHRIIMEIMNKMFIMSTNYFYMSR